MGLPPASVTSTWLATPSSNLARVTLLSTISAVVTVVSPTSSPSAKPAGIVVRSPKLPVVATVAKPLICPAGTVPTLRGVPLPSPLMVVPSTATVFIPPPSSPSAISAGMPVNSVQSIPSLIASGTVGSISAVLKSTVLPLEMVKSVPLMDSV